MKTRKARRTGNVLVLSAVMMGVMFAMVALAVDVGYIQVARTQMQASADAAALAAALELRNEDQLRNVMEAYEPDPFYLGYQAWNAAESFSRENRVDGTEMFLDPLNDVTIGYISSGSQMDAGIVDHFNAVTVQVSKTPGQNGQVALFFAGLLGVDGYSGQMDATAMFLDNISGFRVMPGETAGILPFAFDQDLWTDLIDNGAGNDDFAVESAWNEETQEWEFTVENRTELGLWGDGIREVNLFPTDSGAPGNFGTIDIGAPSNGTPILRRQIEVGLNAEDVSYYPDNELKIDPETGILALNGDTGISGGMASSLEAIIGKPRIVPLYRQVSGNGSNAVYEIVKFVGVRVMEVDLTGGMNSNKRLILQPAVVSIPGAIRATNADGDPETPENQKSQFVYSPVYLIR